MRQLPLVRYERRSPSGLPLSMFSCNCASGNEIYLYNAIVMSSFRFETRIAVRVKFDTEPVIFHSSQVSRGTMLRSLDLIGQVK